jgi:hypothetical protein
MYDTLLIIVANMNFIDVVRAMLDHGAKFYHEDDVVMLMPIASKGHVEVAELLLQRGVVELDIEMEGHVFYPLVASVYFEMWIEVCLASPWSQNKTGQLRTQLAFMGKNDRKTAVFHEGRLGDPITTKFGWRVPVLGLVAEVSLDPVSHKDRIRDIILLIAPHDLYPRSSKSYDDCSDGLVEKIEVVVDRAGGRGSMKLYEIGGSDARYIVPHLNYGVNVSDHSSRHACYSLPLDATPLSPTKQTSWLDLEIYDAAYVRITFASRVQADVHILVRNLNKMVTYRSMTTVSKVAPATGESGEEDLSKAFWPFVKA